jgi:hypothetical protein
VNYHWKGHVPWNRCVKCGCLRPPDALRPIPETDSYVCSDSTICARLIPDSKRVNG